MSYLTYIVATLVVLGMAGMSSAITVAISAGNNDESFAYRVGNAGMNADGFMNDFVAFDMSGADANVTGRRAMNSTNFEIDGVFSVNGGHTYSHSTYRTQYSTGHITVVDGVLVGGTETPL